MSFQNKKSAIILIIVFACFWNLLNAQGQSKIDFFTTSENDIIEITSEKLITFNKENRAVFKNSVIVIKGDMSIKCNELEVFYDNNSKNNMQGGKLDRIVAKGNVRITQGDKAAICGMATLDNNRQILTLSKKPKVWQGKDFMSGQEIVVYMKEGRVEVEGHDGKPVEVIIYSTKTPADVDKTK